MRRKEQMIESKKKKKSCELYVKSLDGTIIVEAPSAALARDAQEMENGDAYLVFQCVVEPNLKSKEIQEAFGCAEPMEIVDKIFDVGEVPQVSVECLKLTGYIEGVKAVDELKN